MTQTDFKLTSVPKNDITHGEVIWESPSNIALVKYWGKKENQIPANPSISFTLNNCATTTKLTYSKKEVLDDSFSFEVWLDKELKEDFKPKIETFFKRIVSYVPFLTDFHFKIETSNSFPHSSGIASSASGMSALALGIMSVEEAIVGAIEADYFAQKASFLARLGSGSACRSIAGPMVSWGTHKNIPQSSNLVGTTYVGELHPVFKDFQDTILLVDQGQKQVSSTVGHNLMHDHPFATQRFEQAHENLEELQLALAKGDLESFIKIVESEALTLHSMMMTSHPYFILMKPNTLEIINKIWAYRSKNQTPVCFTLDAGANVHLLYPAAHKEEIRRFITEELVKYCENEAFIHDHVGNGAKKH